MSSKQCNYESLRLAYPEFTYESFNYSVQADGLHIAFFFRLNDDICFEPTAYIPSRSFLHPDRLSSHVLDSLVFHIGMIELISYWKAACSPVVVVKPFALTDEQIAFWKKLYFNGLGEFFYTNGIDADMDSFMTVRCDSSVYTCRLDDIALFSEDIIHDTHIVPIGGGKDSVVTLEILGGGANTSGSLTTPLDKSSRPLPLIMNPRGATMECVQRAGYSMDDVIVVNRTIHPRLLELNKDGFLNGHTPFSAMLAFYTLLCSALTGTRRRIALSNENSANESTVVGTSVNHQYSKSLEFENDFRSYVANYISKEFDYYSFLRPLSELQIAMLFSRYGHYFDVFKSCNVGSKQDIWCGHCAKCLFAYIILSPFIEPERLTAVFGKNMLDDMTLQLEFRQLTGMAETKPFECVGTVSEVNSALSLSLAKWYCGDRPALLSDYRPMPVMTSLDTMFAENNLPEEDYKKLKSALHKQESVENIFRYRELFNLFAGKEILIAGYGREGMSSYELLQRMFPRRKFDIAHNNEEILVALRGKHYDMVLKSPGIPTFFFDGLCDKEVLTSQSDIFLQVYGDRTVGVTGTKGKSTTTMIIYEALKYDGRGDVIMAGNMGLPLFNIIPQLSESAVVVAELSCHQLEGIHRGPHIGVLLNLFEEHLDHYRSYGDYQMAKMQIGLKQREGDVFFYCSDNEDLSAKVEEQRWKFRSEVVNYSRSMASDSDFNGMLQNSPFKGDHNITNCIVAWMTVQRLGVEKNVFAKALRDCKPLEHRLERVATVEGVTYYNDSISTIPQAAIEGVCALKEVDTLILGGFDRGIDYAPLVDFLCRTEEGKAIGNLVFFGSAGKRIYDAFVKDNSVARRELCHFGADYSMEDAVRFAAANTHRGRICLLSPAASSYDHYKNFEYRGRDFKECVMKLK
ncbi:MAG: UDP-N-acetylmuramoyl-L-alanine--D-glutamate ligase [Bacteroidales bacterium]|nr:UDP-N-acetylmuramoyl-L-alanine--D-glutamate ligase [Bacteroidales bacterium]